MILTLKGTAQKTNEVQLSLSSPRNGLSLTMIHKNADDGTFEGNMNIGVGSATWTGRVVDSVFSSLHLDGAVIGQNLKLDMEK